jgi:hypothetical protein
MMTMMMTIRVAVLVVLVVVPADHSDCLTVASSIRWLCIVAAVMPH